MELRVDVRTVDGGMAARAPASPPPHKAGVVKFPDGERPGTVLQLHLRVAAQAKVIITLQQKFLANRPMGCMADGTAFTQGLVLKDKRSALIPMAPGAV